MPDYRSEYNAELRRLFDLIPKVPNHGSELEERHGDIQKEWVMQIIANPYDRYEEYDEEVLRTILVGRVQESRQWIKVVFIGTPDDGEFLTAYRDRRLNSYYGGGPWESR